MARPDKHPLEKKLDALMKIEADNLSTRQAEKVTGISRPTISRINRQKEIIKGLAQIKVNKGKRVINSDLMLELTDTSKKEELYLQIAEIDDVFNHMIYPLIEKIKEMAMDENPVVFNLIGQLMDKVTSAMESTQKRKEAILSSLELIKSAEDAKNIKDADDKESMELRMEVQRFYEKALVEKEKRRLNDEIDRPNDLGEVAKEKQ